MSNIFDSLNTLTVSMFLKKKRFGSVIFKSDRCIKLKLPRKKETNQV